MILAIKAAVTIPVMAKARIGHFVEAQILEAIEVDYIDESEVLTMADEDNHINKNKFTVPFVCGCRNLGEALRRIAEGAAMLRTKGERNRQTRIAAAAPLPSQRADDAPACVVFRLAGAESGLPPSSSPLTPPLSTTRRGGHGERRRGRAPRAHSHARDKARARHGRRRALRGGQGHGGASGAAQARQGKACRA